MSSRPADDPAVRSRFGGIGPSVLSLSRSQGGAAGPRSVITRLGLALSILQQDPARHATHRILGRRALERRVRGLDAGIIARGGGGGGVYYEGQLSHAERLGLELLLDGERANPARAPCPTCVSPMQARRGDICSERRAAALRPKVIVNAGGAWIDAVNRDLGLETTLMGGSKAPPRGGQPGAPCRAQWAQGLFRDLRRAGEPVAIRYGARSLWARPPAGPDPDAPPRRRLRSPT